MCEYLLAITDLKNTKPLDILSKRMETIGNFLKSTIQTLRKKCMKIKNKQSEEKKETEAIAKIKSIAPVRRYSFAFIWEFFQSEEEEEEQKQKTLLENIFAALSHCLNLIKWIGLSIGTMLSWLKWAVSGHTYSYIFVTLLITFGSLVLKQYGIEIPNEIKEALRLYLNNGQSIMTENDIINAKNQAYGAELIRWFIRLVKKDVPIKDLGITVTGINKFLNGLGWVVTNAGNVLTWFPNAVMNVVTPYIDNNYFIIIIATFAVWFVNTFMWISFARFLEKQFNKMTKGLTLQGYEKKKNLQDIDEIFTSYEIFMNYCAGGEIVTSKGPIVTSKGPIVTSKGPINFKTFPNV